ncbi:MAG: TRAM domain-containing protein, partial [Angelakisella sp.]
DTPAGEREDQLDEELRRRRAERVMELQMGIAFDFAKGCVGNRLQVLVEGKQEGLYFGRSYMDAPDIDTRVYFTAGRKIAMGELVEVEITDSREYDLVGKLSVGKAMI